MEETNSNILTIQVFYKDGTHEFAVPSNESKLQIEKLLNK